MASTVIHLVVDPEHFQKRDALDNDDVIVSSIAPLDVQNNFLTSLTINIHEPGLYDILALASLVPQLSKDDSSLVTINMHGTADSTNETILQSVHTSLTLAGLTAESELKQSNITTVTARLKDSSAMTAQPIKNNIAKLLSENIEDDLIDEDDLLAMEGNASSGLMAPPTVDVEGRKKALDDCGGRKACDDCTCGRAELEAGEAKAASAPSSACGNCSKGDAFRCAGCPFLGKPAFKEGEEHLILDLTDDF